MKQERKPTLILMLGIPGSGKSTLAQLFKAAGFSYLSTDEIRAEIYGTPEPQGGKEWDLFYDRLCELTCKGVDLVIDNTNIMKKDRLRYIDLAKQRGYGEIVIIHVDTPLWLAKQRNKNRKWVVPESVLERMHSNLQKNLPTEEEGKVIIWRT